MDEVARCAEVAWAAERRQTPRAARTIGLALGLALGLEAIEAEV
jgi:hypothetical protein